MKAESKGVLAGLFATVAVATTDFVSPGFNLSDTFGAYTEHAYTALTIGLAAIGCSAGHYANRANQYMYENF